MNVDSSSSTSGQSRSFPCKFRDNQKLKGLSQRDAEIFCSALGLKSTDESWCDDMLDSLEGPSDHHMYHFLF